MNTNINININKNEYNKWLNYSVELKNKILRKSDIDRSLKNFWKDIMLNLDNDIIVLIQFKIKNNLGEYKSISYVQSVDNNNNNLNELIEIFNEFWSLKLEEYHMIIISSIIYNYKIIYSEKNLNENINNISKISSHKKIKQDKQPTFNFGGFNLPNTMDITEWGVSHIYNNYINAIVYKNNSKCEYHITLYERSQDVEMKIGNKIILKFTDSMNDNTNLKSFTRKIKNQIYIFENGILILKKIKRETSYLSKIKLSANRNKNFITMDLETKLINGIMIPYCVCIYDGIELNSLYLTEFKDYTEMLKYAILFLMKRKYNGYRIYFHNFSNFDCIFLFRILTMLTEDINIIYRNNQFIEIKFKFGNYTIFFRDSYLLLPSSLDKLAIAFINENKYIFPYFFVNNSNISLTYEGIIPSLEYFNDVSQDRYNEYCKKFPDNKWNLKNETIKYCNHDVIILYKIINKFSEEIFDMFRLDILKYPTLSSLSFAIFRSNFLKDNIKIPLINGKMFNDIKKSYTGGIVDVYKPYGENIYHYDVNSLYPFVMKEFPMPVGEVHYFEGDITKIEDKPFGFFEVEVMTPFNLNIPLLQTRIKTESGIRTMLPLGKWKGTYLSSEIYNCIDKGYSFKILRGYIFEKDIIFKEFVNHLYEMKLHNDKNNPKYTIAKLLLNSLYGRFGMNPEVENHIIIDSKFSYEYFKKYTITDILDLNNGKELLSYLPNNNDNDVIIPMNISVPIAAAVTAYARIHMTQFLNMSDKTLYYTDTDSIIIDKPLNPINIGKGIGQMKLENIYEKGIFLAPKFYAAKIKSETKNSEKIVIKGLNTSISFKELLKLFKRNKKLKIYQDKWYKNLSKGYIQIKKELYTLKVTDNKRNLIFDKNNKFINTSPFIIQDDKIIK